MRFEELIRNAVATVNEDKGDRGVTVRESYSGRGMYGRACPGIVGTFKEGDDL